MSHTTALKVRQAVPKLLIDEDVIGVVKSGKNITLRKSAFDVAGLTQDDVALTETTDYTFVRPKQITLVVAAAGETYIATCYYGKPDSEITGTYIAQADRIIDNYFYMVGSPGEQYLSDWSAWLAASFIVTDYAVVTKENLALAKSLYNRAMDAMKEYRSNTLYNTERHYPERTRVVKVN